MNDHERRESFSARSSMPPTRPRPRDSRAPPPRPARKRRRAPSTPSAMVIEPTRGMSRACKSRITGFAFSRVTSNMSRSPVPSSATPGSMTTLDVVGSARTIAAASSVVPWGAITRMCITRPVSGRRDFHSNACGIRGYAAPRARTLRTRAVEVTIVKNSVRWLPAVIAPALVIGGVIAVPADRERRRNAPGQDPAAGAHADRGRQGRRLLGHDRADLRPGPARGAEGGTGSSSTGTDAVSTALDLLTADHTARVFVDGPSKQRVQVLDTLAERNVIHNGADVWAYDSKTKTATHVTLTTSEGATPNPCRRSRRSARLSWPRSSSPRSSPRPRCRSRRRRPSPAARSTSWS